MKLAWDSKKTAARQEGKYVRERSAPLYNTSRWHRLSRRYRAMHPLCAECQRNGRIEPATCVDHVIPWPVCGEERFFDETNLQPLCYKCNHDKGLKDKKIIQEWRKEHQQSRTK